MTLPTAEASHLTKGLVRLTMACNERCPFCNVPAEDYPTRPTPQGELDAAVEATLAAGQRTLTVSGGEPTLLRRRLLAFIRDARARGVELIELQTNAVLIDEGYAAALAEAGLTSAFVSLLSHEAPHHDALAGLAGAFPRCLSGLDALLNAGVRVTLNPVTAAQTQALLPDYVDFIAARFPRIRAISVSAVQPHGRAAQALHLLPDYAQLAPAIREARRRAEAHGIELLNPYCGLPLCVGWADDVGRSVEALEAEQGHEALGVENHGNKAHGAPCRGCALRTRCGGAWHAYWAHHRGAGLAAPLARVIPWSAPSSSDLGSPDHGSSDLGPSNPGAIDLTENAAQVVLGPLEAPSAAALARLDAAQAPTRWLSVSRLPPESVPALLQSRVTDLALRWSPSDRESLRGLRLALKDQAQRLPQRRLRAAVWVRARRLSAAQGLEIARLLTALGVDALRLPMPPEALATLRLALPETTIDAPPELAP